MSIYPLTHDEYDRTWQDFWASDSNRRLALEEKFRNHNNAMEEAIEAAKSLTAGACTALAAYRADVAPVLRALNEFAPHAFEASPEAADTTNKLLDAVAASRECQRIAKETK